MLSRRFPVPVRAFATLALLLGLLVFVAPSAPVGVAASCPPDQNVTVAAGDVTGLKVAIAAANSAGCTQTITLTKSTYTLTTVDTVAFGDNGLPALTTASLALTIHGRGSTITRGTGAPAFRLLFMTAGSLAVDDLTFDHGQTSGGNSGGVIDAVGGTALTFTGVTFSNNTATFAGGAVTAEGVPLTVTNATFANNTLNGPSIGGAIASNTTTHITNSTLVGNHAPAGRGGAIGSTFGTTLTNTIAARSTALDGTTPIDDLASFGGSYAGSNNLIGDGGNSGLVNGSSGNQVGSSAARLDPQVGPLADNGGDTQTLTPLAGSPAIDAGTSAGCPATDQRGITRPQGPACDIGAVEVVPVVATKFAVSGYPSPTTAGVSRTVAVIAKDASGATATGYSGTVTLTTSDPQAFIQAPHTLTSGVGIFTVTFKTVGTQSITATGPAPSGGGTIIGSQMGIVVQPAAASQFAVSGYPSPTTAGVSHTFTVTATDANGNTATGYTGTVHFTSTDGAATLPANYTFVAADNGVHIFAATFKTAGTQSITATDTVTASITGTQGGIVVQPAAASQFVVAGYPTPATVGEGHAVTVTAKDAFGNVATGYAGIVTVTTPSDPRAVIQAPHTLSSGATTFTVAFLTPGTQSIVATGPAPAGGGTISGSQTGITVGVTAAAIKALIDQYVGANGGLTATLLKAQVDQIAAAGSFQKGLLIQSFAQQANGAVPSSLTAAQAATLIALVNAL